jgi:hypothetical protein
MSWPVGIFNLTSTKNYENKLEKQLFSSGKNFYRTYVKLKVEGKYVVDMIKY